MSRSDQTLAWLLICIFSLLWIAVGSRSLPQGREQDFQYSYGAARLILDGRIDELYDSALISGPQRNLPYDRPAVAALLYVPFALLPLDRGFALYITVWVALLLVCWMWGYQSFGPFAVVLASMFVPATLGLVHAQDCVLYLALLIWSHSLAKRERLFAAGATLGLMTLKFHLMLVWPLALILQRRWKMLGGFMTMSFLLAAVSFAMVGVSGTRQYVELLLKPSSVSPSPDYMLSFPGLLGNLRIDSLATNVILAIAILGLFLWGLRQKGLDRVYILTTVASLTLIPHAYGYDAARLLLPIWLEFFSTEWRLTKIAAMLMAAPFVYSFTLLGKPWAAAGSIAILSFLVLLVIEPSKAELQKPGLTSGS